MANAAAPTAAVPTLAPPLEQIRHLAEELRLLIPAVRVGEALETSKEFNPETFWRRLNEAAVNVSREATTLTEVFSHLPLPSPQVGFTCWNFCAASLFIRNPIIFFPPFPLKPGDLFSTPVK
ncbi:cyclin-D1-binding protein 1-like [Herpailurus yagouaroundi]|uniref:cyclin-D1-binding protein 1-like n=1 Tax=Herpailurus yagouaroundi TaxID=1608482 RepID=UPI001AD6778E|nr:cyclin-D1-binding protein 1-like [Puma yagouaroundi]